MDKDFQDLVRVFCRGEAEILVQFVLDPTDHRLGDRIVRRRTGSGHRLSDMLSTMGFGVRMGSVDGPLIGMQNRFALGVSALFLARQEYSERRQMIRLRIATHAFGGVICHDFVVECVEMQIQVEFPSPRVELRRIRNDDFERTVGDPPVLDQIRILKRFLSLRRDAGLACDRTDLEPLAYLVAQPVREDPARHDPDFLRQMAISVRSVTLVLRNHEIAEERPIVLVSVRFAAPSHPAVVSAPRDVHDLAQ